MLVLRPQSEAGGGGGATLCASHWLTSGPSIQAIHAPTTASLCGHDTSMPLSLLLHCGYGHMGCQPYGLLLHMDTGAATTRQVSEHA